MTVSGQIDLTTLASLVDADDIDTVVVAFVDLQGRLMGKRVTGRFFLDHVAGTDGAEGEGIEACNYLLTVDVDMNVIEGFRYATWEDGYGDFRGRPDLSTLRVTPWLEKTAMVLCDVVDHHGEPVAGLAPPGAAAPVGTGRRARPDREDRLRARVLRVRRHFDDLAREQYRTLSDHTSSWYNLDYHVFQTTKDEPLIRAIRNGMVGAGLPVEFSKGEAAPGQHELNLRYADALSMADNHTIYKNGAKEIAHLQGKALTFMAKPTIDEPGSSCHIHSSIWSLEDDRPLCAADDDRTDMSPIFRHWLGGHPRPLPRAVAVLRPVRQQLQALPARLVGADRRGLVARQPHLRAAPGRPRPGDAGRVAHPRRRLQRLHRLRRDHRRGARRHRPRARLRRPVRGQRLHGHRRRADPVEHRRGHRPVRQLRVRP